MKKDAELVYNYSVGPSIGLNSKDVIIFGRSMGTGVAVHLAALFDCGALILKSPYYSIDYFIRSHIKLKCTPIKSRFESGKIINKVKCPTLIIHGTRDRMIPINHSYMLFRQLESTIS